MYFPFVSRPPQTVSFGMRLWTIHPFQRLVLDWHMHHCQFLAEWYLVVGYMEGTIEWWVGRWRSWLSVIWWLDYLRRDGWMVWLNGWLVNEWTFSGLRGNGWFAWEWMVCWWNGWFAGGMNLCIDGGCRMAGGWSDITTGAQISSDRTWLVVLSAFPTVQSKVHARTESEQLSHDSYLAGHYSSGLAMMKLCNIYSRSRLDSR